MSKDTRGYLCEPCNLAEGRRNAAQVFLLHRDRHPTSMLGVLHRRKRNRHPVMQDADAAWRDALADLHVLQHPDHLAWRLAQAELLRGFGLMGPFTRCDVPERTPLIVAAERVGFTAEAWAATLQEREAAGRARQVHLADDDEPDYQMCSRGKRWRYPMQPIPHGVRRRPCPDCHQRDPQRVRELVGDGYGGPHVL